MATHIQIGDISPRVQYTGDGVQTVFTYPFPVFTDADIEVYEDATLKTLSTDHTVSGAGNSSGGTVTFITAPASGSVVTIRRNIAIQRTSDFQVAGDFQAKVINDELDYQTAALQQVEADIGRALQLGPTDDGATIMPDKASRSGKYLGFDANGDPIATDAGGPTGPQGPAGNMDGANNLSELTSLPTARTNLGLIIGTDVLAPNGNGSGLTGIVSGATVTEKANIMLNAFRIEVNGGLAVQNMVDGVADVFTDQTGVDTVGSINFTYDAVNHLYSNGASATVSFTASAVNPADLASYTFTGMALGAAATDRKIIVSVSNVIGKAVSTVTVGGISAVLVKANLYDTGFQSEIWQADVPTGTTGDIVVTYASAPNSTGIGVWRVTNAGTGNSAAFSTVGAGGAISVSSAISTPNGILIAAETGNAQATRSAWTNATENYDEVQEAGGPDSQHAGASAVTYSGSLTVTNAMDSGTGSSRSLAMATWASAGTATNMSLISTSTAALSTPASARVFLWEEDVSPVALNTDLKAWASRDGGVTWTQFTLADSVTLATGRILTGMADISAQPVGTAMKYKIETLNAKELKIHGVALQWS